MLVLFNQPDELLADTVLRIASDPLADQLDMGGMHHSCITSAGFSGAPLFNLSELSR